MVEGTLCRGFTMSCDLVVIISTRFIDYTRLRGCCMDFRLPLGFK